MITFKINGQPKQIPTSWEEVTYAQYIQLIHGPSLPAVISIFTGLPEETVTKAELKNLESVLIALGFLDTPPQLTGKSKMVGPYTMPDDVTIQSLGQFEDLRGLIQKLPKTDKYTIEDNLAISDLYLEACAIYVQKIKDNAYDANRVPIVKEELKNYSCMEVLQTGAFFLYRPITMSRSTTTRYRSIIQHLKKMLPDSPNYHAYLDSLLPSSKQAKR